MCTRTLLMTKPMILSLIITMKVRMAHLDLTLITLITLIITVNATTVNTTTVNATTTGGILVTGGTLAAITGILITILNLANMSMDITTDITIIMDITVNGLTRSKNSLQEVLKMPMYQSLMKMDR